MPSAKRKAPKASKKAAPAAAPPPPPAPPFPVVPHFPPGMLLIPPPPGVDPALWAAAAAQHAASNTPPAPKDPERSMKDAAAALQSAAQLSKRRRCMVAVDEVPGFVRTVHTLLRVCDDSIIGWSEDGTQILIKEPDRFAAEVCPKFFRHRNFNSFTRLLNMYQFHKVPSVQRDSKNVCFEHPHFQRNRDDLLPLVQRKGAQTMRDELVAREMFQRPQFPGVGDAGPSQWTRRMAELESDVRALKAENDRLKRLEGEREALKCRVRVQDDLISILQSSQGNRAALVGLPAPPGPASVPGFEAARQLGLPAPPVALQEFIAQLGSGPLVSVMSMMAGALQEGLQRAEAEAAAPSDADAATFLRGIARHAPAPVPVKAEEAEDGGAAVAAAPAPAEAPGGPAKKARTES